MSSEETATVPKAEMIKLIDEITTNETRLEKRIKILEMKFKKLEEFISFIDSRVIKLE